MEKGQRQSIDDRVRGLIKEAVGKIAVDKKVRVMDGAGSPSTCEVERDTPIRSNELLPKNPSSGLEDYHDAVDHLEIDIYGAHPTSD